MKVKFKTNIAIENMSGITIDHFRVGEVADFFPKHNIKPIIGPVWGFARTDDGRAGYFLAHSDNVDFS